jgi:hypothetical protein
VPVYAAPRPLAAMQAKTAALDFSTNLEQVIDLTGSSLAGSEPPTDVVSLASVLELRLRSPNIRPPGLDANAIDLFDHADLKYVGVAAQPAEVQTTEVLPETSLENGAENGGQVVSDETIYFGIVTWSPWSTPNEIRINVLIDTDADGTDDFRLYNLDAAAYGGLWFGPAYVSRLQNLDTLESWIQGPLNGVSASRFDANLFFQSALVLPVSAADLGLSAEQSRFAFHVETSSADLAGYGVTMIDRTPVLYYDVQEPALHFTPPADTAPLWRDAPQTRIQIRLDPVGQARTPAAGVLILHHHNAAGDQVSLVNISYRWPANLYLPVIKR